MYTHLHGESKVLCRVCLTEIASGITHEEYVAQFRDRKELCAEHQAEQDARRVAAKNERS